MDSEITKLLAEIAAARAQTIARLTELSQEELRFKTDNWRWNTARRVVLRFGDHLREHTTQLVAAREDIGAAHTMPQRMLARAQEAYGEFLGAVVGLADEDLDTAPAEGEWTIRQILQHLRETEAWYLARVEEALKTREPVDKD
ncbi:MAG: DinB family protein [Chloroflexi bacterium]|nr:DinB family protein [Chloroflexota bacterium]